MLKMIWLVHRRANLSFGILLHRIEGRNASFSNFLDVQLGFSDAELSVFDTRRLAFFSARASLHKPLHKVPKSKQVGRMSSFRFRQLLFSKKTISSPPSWRPRENSTGNFWYPRVPRFISFSVAAFVFSVATRRGETYIGVLVPYCLVF